MIDTESGNECDGDQVLGEDGEGEFYEDGVVGKCEGKEEEEEGGIEVLAGHSVVGSRKKKRKKKKRALTDKEKQSLMKREEVKA